MACNHDCENCGENCNERDFTFKLNENSSIGKVIGIVSGKGGVGKSLVTSLLAKELTNKGYKVGILDADITGPSIPKMFGICYRAQQNDLGIIPAETNSGIKIMSTNLLLDDPTQPVVWRGPVIAGLVKQFYTDVYWGNLDYLLVDMPPGTGDVPLTVFQSLPVSSIAIVTSPQELVGMIVEKAVNMASMMDIKVAGLVENMSYFHCPDNGKDYKIFGDSHIEEVAEKHGLEVAARLPIDPEIARLSDAGMIESYPNDCLSGLVSIIESIVNEE